MYKKLSVDRKSTRLYVCRAALRKHTPIKRPPIPNFYFTVSKIVLLTIIKWLEQQITKSRVFAHTAALRPDIWSYLTFGPDLSKFTYFPQSNACDSLGSCNITHITLCDINCGKYLNFDSSGENVRSKCRHMVKIPKIYNLQMSSKYATICLTNHACKYTNKICEKEWTAQWHH